MDGTAALAAGGAGAPSLGFRAWRPSATSTRSPRSTSTSARRSARSPARRSRRARRRSTRRPSTRGTCARLLAEQDILGLPFPVEYGGHRHGHADAEHGGRGDRQGRRQLRADPDGAGARHAADPAVRLRRAEGAFSAGLRQRRALPGLRPVGAGGRFGPGRHADHGGAGWRGMGHQRHQELDLQPRRRRLLHHLRRHRPRDSAGSRPSSSRPTAPASASASSSTSSGSAPRRPASRSSRTCGCRRRT